MFWVGVIGMRALLWLNVDYNGVGRRKGRIVGCAWENREWYLIPIASAWQGWDGLRL
jgi:predicted secreted hydrolase